MSTCAVPSTRSIKGLARVLPLALALSVPCTLAAGSRAQGQQLTLRYVWQKGDTAAVSIVVEGSGEARELDQVAPLSLSAAIEAQEKVTRLSTGATAIITTTWQEADIVVDGERVSLTPAKTVMEKKVGSLGEGYWSRTRGRARPARIRRDRLALDAEHLALIDLLVEQVEYPLLAPHPVKEQDTWETREMADFGGEQVRLSKTSKLVSLGTGRQAGLCYLETTINAPLAFTVPEEGLRFSGKIAGTITNTFDNARGRLHSGEGVLEFDLRANPAWADLDLSAVGEPSAPGSEGAAAEPPEAPLDLFRLRMRLMVRVTREYPHR